MLENMGRRAFLKGAVGAAALGALNVEAGASVGKMSVETQSHQDAMTQGLMSLRQSNESRTCVLSFIRELDAAFLNGNPEALHDSIDALAVGYTASMAHLFKLPHTSVVRAMALADALDALRERVLTDAAVMSVRMLQMSAFAEALQNELRTRGSKAPAADA
ncbi:MAG TPA: hypothetical protein VJB97_00855 [Candidatus Paceibacterota bacterium]